MIGRGGALTPAASLLSFALGQLDHHTGPDGCDALVPIWCDSIDRRLPAECRDWTREVRDTKGDERVRAVQRLRALVYEQTELGSHAQASAAPRRVELVGA